MITVAYNLLCPDINAHALPYWANIHAMDATAVEFTTSQNFFTKVYLSKRW